MCFLSLPACFSKADIVIQIKCHRRKKLKPLEGQTQLSFAKRPEEQEAATATEKDDAKANQDNEESAQAKSAKSAKSKERRFFELWLKTYLWLV